MVLLGWIERYGIPTAGLSWCLQESIDIDNTHNRVRCSANCVQRRPQRKCWDHGPNRDTYPWSSVRSIENIANWCAKERVDARRAGRRWDTHGNERWLRTLWLHPTYGHHGWISSSIPEQEQNSAENTCLTVKCVTASILTHLSSITYGLDASTRYVFSRGKKHSISF